MTDLERRLTLAILGRTATDAAREVLGIIKEVESAALKRHSAEFERMRGPSNGINCPSCGVRLPADFEGACPDCGDVALSLDNASLLDIA